MNFPYIHLVPKDLKQNLKFRRELIQMGCSDPKAALDLWIMCKRDILFYINTFGWVHEPRTTRAKSSVLPCITWPIQDYAIEEITTAIKTGHDLCEIKSRDMGASWMNLYCIEHPWHFEHGLAFGLMSRNENYVDDPGNMKALFQKLDFIHEHEPKFLMPTINRVKLHLKNIETGSTIDGESTTGKAMRGDRRTAILMDEFAAFELADGYAALASTQFATDCRLFNSTFESTADAFFDVSENPAIKKIFMPWWDHPLHSKGLFVDDNGKKRSPWYDEQCRRANDPRKIARELDMNPKGAQSQFFDSLEVENLIKKLCRPPNLVGDLDFDRDTSESPVFVERPGGKLSLWIVLDSEGKVPGGRSFSIGADIATGTGASNSCMTVRDRESGQKVAEWVDPNTRPDVMGRIGVALAKFFNNALIVPEAAGPGRNFMDVVMTDLHYGNVYLREQIRTLDKRRMLIPGWWPTPESKWELFGEYRRAMLAGHCDEPSDACLRECLDYVFINNTVSHIKSVNSNDPSGARDNHGDRPTASALSWKGVRYSPVDKRDAEPQTIPPNSIAGRRAAAEKKRREKELQWN